MNTLRTNADPRTISSLRDLQEDSSLLWQFMQRSDCPQEASDLAELWAAAEREVAAETAAGGEHSSTHSGHLCVA